MADMPAAPSTPAPPAAPAAVEQPAGQPAPFEWPMPKPSQAPQPAAVPVPHIMDQVDPAMDPVEQEERAEAAFLAEQLRQSDEMAFRGPETIAGYNFGAPPPGVEQSMEQEVAMRTLFQQEGIPVSIGNEIGRMFNAAIAHPPSEIDRKVQHQICGLQLERVWGADTAKNVAIAQAEVARMAQANPGILRMLEQSGLGDSPYLARTLFNLATAKGRAR